MVYKIVITDFAWNSLSEEKRKIEGIDTNVIHTKANSRKELAEVCKDADGILLDTYTQMDRDVLEKLNECRIISSFGIGFNQIDLQAATENGIFVANVPDYCVDEVSTHALSLTLSLARKIPNYWKDIKNGKWSSPSSWFLESPIHRLKNQKLGLVGFGKIAQELARKTRNLFRKVLTYDPYVDESLAKDHGVKLIGFEDLVSSSDFISLHAPLAEDTEDMMGMKEFKSMKRSGFLVNTARAGLINKKSLIKALQEKEIAGAALDVGWKEPMSNNDPLIDMENVVLTPHAAWYSEESSEELQDKSINNIVKVLQGEKPDYLLNFEQAKENL